MGVSVFIGALQKTTLTDFPGKVACIVFLVNCNFKCKFCYNKELTAYKFFKKSKRELIQSKDFFDFLEAKKKMLDGVVITGGEPTLSPGLYDFIKKIKSIGLAVKLDSNGTRPSVLRKLIADKLVDYIAMDIKAPLSKYKEITQSSIPGEVILESIDLIRNSGVPHEFRTTLYPKLTKEDLIEMSHFIPKEKWFWQSFEPKQALDLPSRKLKPMKPSEVKLILAEVRPEVDVVFRE
ncbi:MAG: anaerobic ribonucleoside-triphosphate reductase activating protein [archaeon]|jgi:pyruvate formate lyase activating enzyme